MRINRKSILVFIVILALISGGCWNRREPEFLAIVIAMAFDYDEERELYQVIAQVANPLMMDPEGVRIAGEDRAFWVVSAYGHTPFDATRNLSQGSSRQYFWAHNRIVLFSEAVARQGIREILDFIDRERQLRLIGRPAVVEGDIRKLMEADFPIEEKGGTGLDRQMVTIQFEESVFHDKFLIELYTSYESPGWEMFMGKIEVQEEAIDSDEDEGEDEDGNEDEAENDDDGGGELPGEDSPSLIGGGALFKGDRMVGWATEFQSEGWLYAEGRGHRYNLTFEGPEEYEDTLVSIEVFDTISEMRPVVNGDDIRVEIEVNVNGRIQNISSVPGMALEKDNVFLRSLERRAAQVVRNRIKDMMQRSQELETDIMGFGNLLYRKKPEVWEQVKDDWDDMYPDVAADIDVFFNIKRSGLISRPLP